MGRSRQQKGGSKALKDGLKGARMEEGTKRGWGVDRSREGTEALGAPEGRPLTAGGELCQTRVRHQIPAMSEEGVVLGTPA